MVRLTTIILELGQAANNALMAAGYGQNVDDDIEAQRVAETNTADGDTDTDENDEDGEAQNGKVDNPYSGADCKSPGTFA